ncbi:hypothetical protein [Tropicimonas sediminicola]|uniref:hypothetical protein n=1 Tax=Tropicimonas sediminicola TaxID=1031541 RepID=UPI000B78502A|nr:hypothetical protein [Tropicimonas sediminicola]
MKNVNLSAIILLAASPAHAYVGPGAGLGAIAAAFAVIVGLLLLLVGFVYFPVRRMLRARRETSGASDTSRDTR